MLVDLASLNSTEVSLLRKTLSVTFQNTSPRRAAFLTASVNASIYRGGHFLLTEAVKKPPPKIYLTSGRFI
jgi:hypothetical protein